MKRSYFVLFGAASTFSKAASPSMSTEFMRTCFKEVMKKIMGSCDSVNVWNENMDKNAESFVGFIQ